MHKLKIHLSGQATIRSKKMCDIVLGYLHGCLGVGNKYHDTFSCYSWSGVHGWGRIEDIEETGEKQAVYTHGGHIYVTSNQIEFIQDLLQGLIQHGDSLNINGLKFCGVEMSKFIVHKDYDIIKPLSPIVLRIHKEYLDCTDSERFFGLLQWQSKQKLIKCGLDPVKVDTLKIEPYDKGSFKIKHFGLKGGEALCNDIMLRISGDRAIRGNLYGMGLGNKTGCGFGNVKVYGYHPKTKQH